MPAGLTVPKGSLILAEVRYEFQSTLSTLLVGSVLLEAKAYQLPRYTDQVVKEVAFDRILECGKWDTVSLFCASSALPNTLQPSLPSDFRKHLSYIRYLIDNIKYCS